MFLEAIIHNYCYTEAFCVTTVWREQTRNRYLGRESRLFKRQYTY